MPEQPNGLPLSDPTMADKLKQAGYATHMVGKWHLGFYRKEYKPNYRGFDSFYGKISLVKANQLLNLHTTFGMF